jgi:hypothetical protein
MNQERMHLPDLLPGTLSEDYLIKLALMRSPKAYCQESCAGGCCWPFHLNNKLLKEVTQHYSLPEPERIFTSNAISNSSPGQDLIL